MKIKIFYDETNYRLRKAKECLRFIERVIRSEKRLTGDLSFIITSDKNILEINRKFLNHDYHTDVITFGYNKGKMVNGEIYISLETVKINAVNYKVSLRNELLRTMIHGTLHLCGYDDRAKEEIILMKKVEERYLSAIT